MILIVRHYQDREVHDSHGKVVEKKGMYVSHGIDTVTDEAVILPWERWENFAHNCVQINGEWYLK